MYRSPSKPLNPILQQFVSANSIRGAANRNGIRAARASGFFDRHGQDINVGVLYADRNGKSKHPDVNDPGDFESASGICDVLVVEGVCAKPVKYRGPQSLKPISEKFNIIWMNCPLYEDRGNNVLELVKRLNREHIPYIGHTSTTYGLAIDRIKGMRLLARLGIEPSDFRAINAWETARIAEKGDHEPLIVRSAIGRGGEIVISHEGGLTISTHESLVVEKLYTGPEYFLIMGTPFFSNGNGRFSYHYGGNAMLPLRDSNASATVPMLQLLIDDKLGIFKLRGENDGIWRRREQIAKRSRIVQIPKDEADKIIAFAKKVYRAFGCSNVVGIDVRLESENGPARFIDMEPILDLGMPTEFKSNLVSVATSQVHRAYADLVLYIFTNGIIRILDAAEAKLAQNGQ
jgi:hypothetical protein